jgi:sugar phosphate isomerase/epimerase
MREPAIPTFYSLSQPISKTLEEFAAAGVQLVELHGDVPETHIDLTDEREVEDLARVVRGLPLEVYSVHCGFSRPSEEAWDISQPDEAKRGYALGNRAKVIRAAARLEARHVVIHPGVRRRGEAGLLQSRASLAHLARIAEDVGMKIAAENLPPDQLGGSLEEMERLLDGLDPGVVGFCLDTGHAMLGEDPVGDYIRAFGGRMLGVHWHGNDSVDDAHLFPDAADPEWEDFFAVLDEVGYDLPVTIEAVPPPTMSLEEAVHSVREGLQSHRAPRPA